MQAIKRQSEELHQVGAVLRSPEGEYGMEENLAKGIQTTRIVGSPGGDGSPPSLVAEEGSNGIGRIDPEEYMED